MFPASLNPNTGWINSVFYVCLAGRSLAARVVANRHGEWRLPRLLVSDRSPSRFSELGTVLIRAVSHSPR